MNEKDNRNYYIKGDYLVVAKQGSVHSYLVTINKFMHNAKICMMLERWQGFWRFVCVKVYEIRDMCRGSAELYRVGKTSWLSSRSHSF